MTTTVNSDKLEDSEGVEDKEVESKSHKEEIEGDKTREPPAKKKKKRGMNKNRPRAAQQLDFKVQLCNSIARGEECAYGDKCRYLHDVAEYMEKCKASDIGENCVNFEKFGYCMYGVTCRYGKKHISMELKNIVNAQLYEATVSLRTKSVLSKELTNVLRKRKYEFPQAETYLKHLAKVKAEGKPNSELGNLARIPAKLEGPASDEDVIKLRPEEKKKVKWSEF